MKWNFYGREIIMKKNNQGFTLAELLIVVAIIAVLVAVSIPIFSSQLEKSREATDLSNVRAKYSEIMAIAITGDKPAEGSDIERTGNRGSYIYTAEVALNQQSEGWDTALPIEVGGVQYNGTEIADQWIGEPQSEGKCIITYNQKTKLICFNWGGQNNNVIAAEDFDKAVTLFAGVRNRDGVQADFFSTPTGAIAQHKSRDEVSLQKIRQKLTEAGFDPDKITFECSWGTKYIVDNNNKNAWTYNLEWGTNDYKQPPGDNMVIFTTDGAYTAADNGKRVKAIAYDYSNKKSYVGTVEICSDSFNTFGGRSEIALIKFKPSSQ